MYIAVPGSVGTNNTSETLAETLVVFSRTLYFASKCFPLTYFINTSGENNYITHLIISKLVPSNGCTFLSGTF